MTTETRPIAARLAHEDRLMPLFGQLAAHVLQRGLEFARADDPHLFAQAAKVLHDSGCIVELRVRVDPAAGTVATVGVIVDREGEPRCELFTVTGRPPNAGETQ